MRKAFALILFPAFLFIACESEPAVSEDTVRVEQEGDTGTVYQRARNIFYSMPSPLEFTSLIKDAGGEYRKELIHDPNKASAYQSLQQRSLMLGVYGADLSYTSVFHQQQDAIKLLAATKRLGENIGVSDAFSADLMERANSNMNNQDSMMQIMTEMYWQTNSQLREENRDPIALLVMLGGWAEGLYLGSSNMDKEGMGLNVGQRLAEQKFTAMQIRDLFQEYATEELVMSAYPLFAPLIDKFLSLEIEESTAAVTTTEKDGVFTIGGKKEVIYSNADIQEISRLAKELRAKLVAV